MSAAAVRFGGSRGPVVTRVPRTAMYPHRDKRFITQRGVSPRGFLERGRRSEETHERRPPELTAYAPRDALLVVAGNRLPANLGNSGLLRILGSGLTTLRQGASTSHRAATTQVKSVYRKPVVASRG